MSFLELKIIETTTPGRLSNDGTCNKPLLGSISLSELLVAELYARLRNSDTVLLPTMQQIVLMVGEQGNDAATLEALKVVYDLMVPTHLSSAPFRSPAKEEYLKKQRREQMKFLSWLIPIFWELRVYSIGYNHSRFGGSHLVYGNPLKETKHWIVSMVSKMWHSEHDQVGQKAFWFLCDLVDSKRFFTQAKNIENKPWHYTTSESRKGLCIQADDLHKVTAEMRDVLPAKLPIITSWLALHSSKREVPWEVKKLLGHAAVNAGGAIVIQ